MSFGMRFFIFVIFIFSLFTPRVAKADSFNTTATTTYIFDEHGNAKVDVNVILKNEKLEEYASDFIYNLQSITPINARAARGGEPIRVVEIKNDQERSLLIELGEPVTGVGNSVEFNLNYEIDKFATKTGEVWDIVIPSLINDHNFDEFEVKVVIPKSYGNIAYVSPAENKFEESDNSYAFNFSKEKVENFPISLGLGEFQVYTLDLIYQLKNDSQEKKSMEIALPPDTSYQKMFYELIAPFPENVNEDAQGNWIASYSLDKNEEIEVKVTARAQILAKPQKINTNYANDRPTNKTAIWDTEDPQISAIAQHLGNPKRIYEYVVSNLNYDYSKIGQSYERKGASSLLRDPSSALCTDFSDLFIGLSRSINIPAREIQGYAISDDPALQPLNLNGDLLHSWVEYWSTDEGHWIPTDPTWGKTSEKDYFSSFDLKHIAFVIHSQDSMKPEPAGFYKFDKEKQVLVSLSSLPATRKPNFTITHKTKSGLGIFGKSYEVKVVNNGPVAAYGAEITVDQGGMQSDTKFEFIAPFGHKTITVDQSYPLFSTQTPKEIKISMQEAELIIPTHRNTAILLQAFLFSIVLLFVSFIVFVLLGKIRPLSSLKD